jgi:carbon starvation protein CstA
MIAILNVGRLLMVIWIGYGLVLIFAPALLHRPPDQFGGAIQVGVAFALGWLLDRALSAVHRRRAGREVEG